MASSAVQNNYGTCIVLVHLASVRCSLILSKALSNFYSQRGYNSLLLNPYLHDHLHTSSDFCYRSSITAVTCRGCGLDDWIYWHLIHITRDYRQYSAIVDLQTLQLHALAALSMVKEPPPLYPLDFRLCGPKNVEKRNLLLLQGLELWPSGCTACSQLLYRLHYPGSFH
jgi:hypothetical protein